MAWKGSSRNRRNPLVGVLHALPDGKIHPQLTGGDGNIRAFLLCDAQYLALAGILQVAHLFEDSSNALEFKVQVRNDLLPANGEYTRLVDACMHDEWLLGILADPDSSRIIIVSPWIVIRTIEKAGILTAIRNAVECGKEVIVYTDPALNGHSGSYSPSNLDIAEEAFASIRVELKKVRQIHSKVVMVDGRLLSSGSYNWLSAAREGDFVRHELSYVYEGPNVENEIRFHTDSLDRRLVDAV